MVGMFETDQQTQAQIIGCIAWLLTFAWCYTRRPYYSDMLFNCPFEFQRLIQNDPIE